MKKPSGTKGDELRAVTPALCDYTDRILYDDVWERPGLSTRDRCLITVAALVALYRPEQIANHLTFALDNGISKEELGEAITHLAFYTSWPNAVSASRKLLDLVEEREAKGKP